MKIKVPVGDLRIGPEERRAINEVLDSGRVSEGDKVREFERDFANFIGTRYAITLNSGTSAIIAGLMALEYNSEYRIKKGTKVITTPTTYIATSNAIVLSGLDPVYLDVGETTKVKSSKEYPLFFNSLISNCTLYV